MLNKYSAKCMVTVMSLAMLLVVRGVDGAGAATKSQVVIWQKPNGKNWLLATREELPLQEEIAKRKPLFAPGSYISPDNVFIYRLVLADRNKKNIQTLWQQKLVSYSRGRLKTNFTVLNAGHDGRNLVMIHKAMGNVYGQVINSSKPAMQSELYWREAILMDETPDVRIVSASIRGKLSNNTLAAVVKVNKDKEHRFFYDKRTKKWSRVPPKRDVKKTVTPSPRATPMR